MLTVKHRPDRLIQKNAQRHPEHAAILQFLEERLIGKDFEDWQALARAMAEWPAFAQGDERLKGQRSSTLRRMIFTHDNYIGLSPGTHGPLDIAIFEEV